MRVFLRKPKWLAYLLLVIILWQAVPRVARYTFGSRELTRYEDNRYSFALDHPGNWVIETYDGDVSGREGVIVVLADSSGFFAAPHLLTIYRRPAAQPSLTGAAAWGLQMTTGEGGHSPAAVLETTAGPMARPALRQALHYDEDGFGLNFYVAGDTAEYVLAFRSVRLDEEALALFERMAASFQVAD